MQDILTLEDLSRHNKDFSLVIILVNRTFASYHLLTFSHFQASQLCLVEGVRNRYRARIGLHRRHRHPEPDQDENRHQDTEIRRGARGEEQEHEEERELLEVAENGRYKVVAKAEPYKNLPVRENLTVLYKQWSR